MAGPAVIGTGARWWGMRRGAAGGGARRECPWRHSRRWVGQPAVIGAGARRWRGQRRAATAAHTLGPLPGSARRGAQGRRYPPLSRPLCPVFAPILSKSFPYRAVKERFPQDRRPGRPQSGHSGRAEAAAAPKMTMRTDSAPRMTPRTLSPRPTTGHPVTRATTGHQNRPPRAGPPRRPRCRLSSGAPPPGTRTDRHGLDHPAPSPPSSGTPPPGTRTDTCPHGPRRRPPGRQRPGHRRGAPARLRALP
ncbi:hypothetical protein F4561_004337 [Lipingzhangella halophila]|uniref:Uncharacterized protein n=1 Tax=Lipingzhangella halophila TaxID=1783352 RepID=A0A7W7RKK0_9ACTN|nr:hypothetical protein [Lipingzhangella halophila]